MIIYKITNKLDGKIYIGQTVQKLRKRWEAHCRPRRGAAQLHLFRAVQKHGVANFTVEQIDSAQTLEGLNALEEMYIAKFACLSPNGYNLLPGGANRRLHEETKAKLSQALKGRPILNRWTGGNTVPPSSATRQQISLKLKGRPIQNRWTGGNRTPRTEAQKAHLRRLNVGKPNAALHKRVRCVETGAEYESVNAAAAALGVNRVTVSAWLRSGKPGRLGLTLRFL